MKHILFFLVALASLVVTGCIKTSVLADQPQPSGVFSGQFLFVHRPNLTARYDTLKANIILTMQIPAKTYTVAGDTSKHAGSHGSYSFAGTLINFNDVTYPVDGTIPTKKHLSGVYSWSYDGTTLQMLGFNSDTSAFEYVLKKN